MRLALALLSALLLAGCGEKNADAVDVAETWFTGVAERQPRDACEVMTVSATRALRDKYVQAPEGAVCEEVVAAYARLLTPAKREALQEEGFEAGEPTPGGELGVFPAAQAHETEILLMREVGGKWRIVSVGIPPR